jgi:hypothetical protein
VLGVAVFALKRLLQKKTPPLIATDRQPPRPAYEQATYEQTRPTHKQPNRPVYEHKWEYPPPVVSLTPP